MGVPARIPCIQSCNAVRPVSRGDGKELEGKDISLFKHFWQRVLGLAFTGPLLSPGAFRYRFIYMHRA